MTNDLDEGLVSSIFFLLPLVTLVTGPGWLLLLNKNSKLLIDLVSFWFSSPLLLLLGSLLNDAILDDETSKVS